MLSKKFWKHIDEALDDIHNAKSYYVGGTLCIDFDSGAFVGLNLDGTGFTRGGKLYIPDHIKEKVINVHREIRGETEYFKTQVVS